MDILVKYVFEIRRTCPNYRGTKVSPAYCHFNIDYFNFVVYRRLPSVRLPVHRQGTRPRNEEINQPTNQQIIHSIKLLTLESRLKKYIQPVDIRIV